MLTGELFPPESPHEWPFVTAGCPRATIFSVEIGLRALVVDDEPQICALVGEILRSDGWNVTEVHSFSDCMDVLGGSAWDLVFCDVMLGEADGYAILKHFREMNYGGRFVLMTGRGSAVGALDATAIGAYDYLLKPFTIGQIKAVADSVKDLVTAAKPTRGRMAEEPKGYVSDIPLIGNSPRFVECLKMVGRVASTDMPVLITGESGTGKEVVARAIHLRSRRAASPFVAVNCGAIPVDLIESELFGHIKGSFTGADRDRSGLWLDADRGSIFLDEITETGLLFQVKLLRALQEGEIRRVGANSSQKVDVRVIAATNRKIENEVDAGRFRQDLMYRLNAVTIELPPLRHRREDIRMLAEHFLANSGVVNEPSREFSREALQLMENYDWPGNVRELENAVMHALSMSDMTIYPEHLPTRLHRAKSGIDDAHLPVNGIPDKDRKWLTLAEAEAEYVAKVLDHTGNNKQAAARILNIDRKTLTRIASRYSEQGEK
jgi:DNA-binding NtrC family response regulator